MCVNVLINWKLLTSAVNLFLWLFIYVDPEHTLVQYDCYPHVFDSYRSEFSEAEVTAVTKHGGKH